MNIPWNKGLTKENHKSIKKISDALKGRSTWSKGLTKETNNSVKLISEKLKNRSSWSKGLKKENDERVSKISLNTKGKNKGKIPWNKGLTKQTDERVLSVSRKISEYANSVLNTICKPKRYCKCGRQIKNNSKTGCCGNCFRSSDIYRKILSQALKGKTGGFREESVKRFKGARYDSKFAGNIYLPSSWEIAYAKYLDNNNISWTRPTKGFQYFYNNTEHRYYPDFYLTLTNEYVEIKNFTTNVDRAKWEQFPYKLTVLSKDELIKLGLIDKYKRVIYK